MLPRYDPTVEREAFHFKGPNGGHGQLDPDGATWTTRRGRQVRILWTDITRIRWTRASVTLSDGSRRLYFPWLWIASSEDRGPAEWLLRDVLRDFDLTHVAPPETSFRRIAALALPAFVLVCIGFPWALMTVSDAHASQPLKQLTILALAGPLFSCMLVGGWLVWRDRDTPVNPRRWRTRAP